LYYFKLALALPRISLVKSKLCYKKVMQYPQAKVYE